MLLIRFLTLISFLFVLTCVVAAVSQKRKTFFGKTYIFYTTLVAGYVLLEFLNITIFSATFNYIVLKLQSFFWVMVGSAFYMFSIAVCEKKNTYLYKVFLAFSALLSVVSLSSPLVISGISKYHAGYDIVPGPLFIYVVILAVCLPFLLGLIEISVYSWKERAYVSGVTKSHLIIIGSVISIVGAITTDAIIPHVLNIDSAYRIGANMSVFQTILVYIAIHEKYISKVRIEDLNHLIYRYSGNPILLLDENNSITHCNEAAYSFIDKPYSEIFGNRFEDVFTTKSYGYVTRDVIDDDAFQGKIVLIKYPCEDNVC